MVISNTKEILNKELFNPKLIGIFTNPYYFIRKGLFRSISRNDKHVKGKLLDFGCGHKPYRAVFKVDEYIGLDIEVSGHDHKNEHIDVYYDGKRIPFQDDFFDSVFSSEVFEHLFNIKEILLEINRVLKPGGHLLITVPFVWEEHEIPYDFARYSSYGIEFLLKESGFEIVTIEKTTNYIETIFQIICAYIHDVLFPKRFKTVLNPFFIAPLNIIGSILSKILPDNKKFYHNNVVVAKKIVDDN
jgi:SAM-dependent methyltransferase